jgi:glutathione peroxidase-family protein
VGLSKRLTPRWALGLQVMPKIETFGKAYKPLFSMDLNATSFAKLSSNLYWDSEINIPVRISSNTRNDAPLQSFLRMSMSYVFSKQCQTGVHVKQMLPYKTQVGLQLCYLPIPSLALFGIVGTSSNCGFGIQYVLDRITCRFQTQYLPIVGYSTNVGVSYQFKHSQKTDSHDF